MEAIDRRVQELRHLIQDIFRHSRRVDEAAAQEVEAVLSIQELHVIEYLGHGGPRMMRELADYLEIASHSATSTVDNLEAKKLARRQRSEQDRRVVHVELTDAGRAVYEKAVGFKDRLHRAMLSTLNDEEQEIFMLLLRKIARTELPVLG
jgi:MarR family 2-MHQ and catechol resistance regulon transcriptional repressor